MSKRVVIVGGGLAGIAAAAMLSERGFHTTLIERRAVLGGRAGSFRDPQTGQLLDSCQHVLLGCCTALLDLYHRLGVLDKIQFFDRIVFADERARRGSLYATALPAPFHLAWAMLRFPLLTTANKFEIARAMSAMKLLGAEGRNRFLDITFASWLHDHGQSPSTIARFWNVILTSALNEDVAGLSAKYGLQVFQDAFLGPRNAWKMALATVPLAELYAKPVVSELRLSTVVSELIQANGRVTGVRVGDESIAADYVIMATALDSAQKLLAPLNPPSAICNPQFSPIIGAHLWYDRPVMDRPHLALIGTQLHWLFRKDYLTGAGTHIHAVISAARKQVDVDNEELTRQFDAEIRTLLPQAREAKLLRSLILKEKRATFSPAPGVDRIRPSNHSGIPGLLLAGDYTQTDWPATMEGAVRSGYAAARMVLAEARSAEARNPNNELNPNEQ